MERVIRKAHAKINLTLDVTGKRADGYHTVKMIMQTVGLHDDIVVTRNDADAMTMSSNLSWLPTDDGNLAMRAAKLFYAEVGLPMRGVHIEIFKRIPVAAGLAGGSTDAAAVLRALNTLHETNLSDETLCKLGLRLGADVPYCLMGGSMLAEGIGEVLTALPTMPFCYVVLCKPSFSVSTAEIYSKMNGGRLRQRPDTVGMIRALRERDWNGICHRLYNVMEAVTGRVHPEIGLIQDELLSRGASGTVMSGSGPAVFGLFSSLERAQAAGKFLKKRYSETFVTEILETMV